MEKLWEPTQKKKEEASQFNVNLVTQEPKDFSVRKRVKEKTFSLAQLKTEMRTADSASDMREEIFFSSDFLYVSITDLKPSDSGRYWCRSDTWKGILYNHFNLTVIEDSSKPKWTTRPFVRSTFLPADSTTTKATKATTMRTTATSQSQSFSPSPSETIKLSDKPAAASDQLLYVGLSLVLIILLATALLIYCWRKRFHQQKGRPVDTNPPDLTINTVYEEIREDGRENKPPAGEISSVYVSVQPNKPNAAESNAIYSLASEPQCQAKEEAEYSEVQMLNDDNGSNGGHLGVSDNVMYSEPQLDMSSGSHGNGSPAIYSTITLEPELC
ncbi:uncharacterized protein LOC103132289 isoform X1 [Poecilia formosa]|uniref:uncharacterized protein LOC103132289 isoform X1 n=1 Tax=Poecilia formosa TaxID=48698 RepID=UPI0007B8104D|nr:PREDICTED: uncharacterized protein LOC103132289 isoform X1 [Poecilia formosa]XP_016522776.1 PREDICTED: uncharacterized protein LOC103132289 isoform X1 [Poecilia formosa]